MRINWAYVVAGLGVIAAIGVLVIAGQWLPEAKRRDLLFEGAKVAIGVLPLALFSVIVNDLVRRRDEERQANQARDEFRRRFLNDVVVAYNRAKAARRQLRGAGIVKQAKGGLSPEQLTTIDTQLIGLSDTQLDLERLKREAVARGSVFRNIDSITTALRQLESYVNAVVKEWEQKRSTIAAGTQFADMSEWITLWAFVASRTGEGNFGIAADLMKEIEAAIWPDLVTSN